MVNTYGLSPSGPPIRRSRCHRANDMARPRPSLGQTHSSDVAHHGHRQQQQQHCLFFILARIEGVKKFDPRMKISAKSSSVFVQTAARELRTAREDVRKLIAAQEGSQTYTEQQLTVWAACKLIPKGRVASYGTIAKVLQKSMAQQSERAVLSRLVGKYLSQNPVAPDVPCHRVVANNGHVHGFRGGSNERDLCDKAKLLAAEGVTLTRLQQGWRVTDVSRVL